MCELPQRRQSALSDQSLRIKLLLTVDIHLYYNPLITRGYFFTPLFILGKNYDNMILIYKLYLETAIISINYVYYANNENISLYCVSQ